MIIWSMTVFIQNDLMVWCTRTFSEILFCWMLYIPGNSYACMVMAGWPTNLTILFVGRFTHSLSGLQVLSIYRIYPKYSDTSTPYHICSKI